MQLPKNSGFQMGAMSLIIPSQAISCMNGILSCSFASPSKKARLSG
jgi:hypothetical protein